MKIAVSAAGDSIDAIVDPRFGRCTYFVIVDVEREEIKSSETVENPGARATSGAGILAAQTIANKGAEVVITGNIGPNAFTALSQTGIKIVTGAFGISIKAAVQSYLNGELRETVQPTPGFGPRMGRGRRFGRR